jgi:hypothetical protein
VLLASCYVAMFNMSFATSDFVVCVAFISSLPPHPLFLTIDATAPLLLLLPILLSDPPPRPPLPSELHVHAALTLTQIAVNPSTSKSNPCSPSTPLMTIYLLQVATSSSLFLRAASAVIVNCQVLQQQRYQWNDAFTIPLGLVSCIFRAQLEGGWG